MKNRILAILILATAGLFSVWGCDEADNQWNPNGTDGMTNPIFATDLAETTINTTKDGGNYTVNVTQNTSYRWIATSNQSWAVLNVAATDTIDGDKALTIAVSGYTDVASRTATITLKEVAPKTNRTITFSVVQAGAQL
ncbi:MAG: hypothetical protein ACK5JD_12360 [Mangrovibacterium sp.]